MSSDSADYDSLVDSFSSSRQYRWKRPILLVVVPLLMLLVAGVAYLKGGRYVETDNAYIKTDKIPISAEVSGKIQEVLVIENQPVVEGQILFRLDPTSFQIAVTKAEAELAQVRIDLEALRASYQVKQAQIVSARTEYSFARNNLRRQEELASQHLISVSSLDDVKEVADLAERQIDMLEKDLKQIAETLGGNINLPLEQHPRYRMALAELRQAQIDLERSEIRAPRDGFVSRLPKWGQYLSTGALASVLLVDENPWVEANFTETDLTYVNPGQSARIYIDTYPDVTWQGVVESLSPATGEEFSIIPAQNATGNWVKVVQRVPVRIKIVTGPDMPTLRSGLSAIVKIDTNQQRLLLGFSF